MYSLCKDKRTTAENRKLIWIIRQNAKGKEQESYETFFIALSKRPLSLIYLYKSIWEPCLEGWIWNSIALQPVCVYCILYQILWTGIYTIRTIHKSLLHSWSDSATTSTVRAGIELSRVENSSRLQLYANQAGLAACFHSGAYISNSANVRISRDTKFKFSSCIKWVLLSICIIYM